MKLVCNCGNEQEFNTRDENGEEYSISEDEGQYATIDNFSLWQSHYVVGVVCDKCKKSIWVFT